MKAALVYIKNEEAVPLSEAFANPSAYRQCYFELPLRLGEFLLVVMRSWSSSSGVELTVIPSFLDENMELHHVDLEADKEGAFEGM